MTKQASILHTIVNLHFQLLHLGVSWWLFILVFLSNVNEDAAPGSTMAALASLQWTQGSILWKCSFVLLVTPMKGPSLFLPYLSLYLWNIGLMVLISLVKVDVLWSLIVYYYRETCWGYRSDFLWTAKLGSLWSTCRWMLCGWHGWEKIIMTGGHGWLLKWLVKWDRQVLFILIACIAGWHCLTVTQ